MLDVNGTTKVVFGGTKQVIGDTLNAQALVEKMRLDDERVHAVDRRGRRLDG